MVIVLAVSLYLIVVFLILAIGRRLDVHGKILVRWIASRLRRPLHVEVRDIVHRDGRLYESTISKSLVSDSDGTSELVLYEDDVPMPHPHAPHIDIRRLGHGRYSHWENSLYFSSGDGSDPRHNGRQYRLEEAPIAWRASTGSSR